MGTSLHPEDPFDSTLMENVHPKGWKNPEPGGIYNLVVIGAGTAGLVAAAGAAGLGARVALIERELLGGDCLNAGCVPSKALIRASRAAGDILDARRYGVYVPDGFKVDFVSVMERLRRLRARISHHDSALRFQRLGVDVYFGEARFINEREIDVGGRRLGFRKALIATGARASRPLIDGLADAGYHTNETIFSITERPDRLAVIGGGPLGCELAQAFSRLGSRVVILHKNECLLDKGEKESSELLQRVLTREGIELVLNSKVLRVERRDREKLIFLEKKEPIGCDEILVAIGRSPNVEGMGLEAAGIAYDLRRGVHVDDFLATTNPNVYAAGDVCMVDRFTHAADAASRIVLRNAFFPGKSRVSSLTIPRCTYTDPEIAHVGLTEREASARGMPIETFSTPLIDVDRAVLDGEEEGFVTVHTRRGTDRIVGATVVARHAGEMVNEVTLAMVSGVGLKTLANTIHPYPTQAEAIRKTADLYNRSRLTPLAKRLLRYWFSFLR